ncbi:MAG: AAA family ATPase [Candidatus Woesearchaeota archaeon]
MYLKTLTLHNFESYKHTEFNFCKGLNMVTGGNGQGKTAAIKDANLWCTFNDLSGDWFVRNDYNKKPKKDEVTGELKWPKENECYVTQHWVDDENGDEYLLTRKRVKRKNYYIFVDEYGEIHEFENPGNDVPALIKEKLKIKTFKVDDDIMINTNIIGAKDIGFFQQSGNYQAKVIGALSGTAPLDIAVRKMERDIKSLSLDIKKGEKSLEELDEEIKKYEPVLDKQKLLEKIDFIYFGISELNFQRAELNKINQRIIGTKKQINVDKKQIENKGLVNKKEQLLNKLETLLAKSNSLLTTRKQLQRLNNSINEKLKMIEYDKKIISTKNKLLKQEQQLQDIENQLKENQLKALERIRIREKLSSIIVRCKDKINKIKEDKLITKNKPIIERKEKQITIFEKQVNKVNGDINSKKDLSLKLNKLNDLIVKKSNNDKKGKSYIKHKKIDIDKLINEYVYLVKDLGKCPLCLSPINEEHLKSIKEELKN